MKRLRSAAALTLSVLSLAGCATHTWVAGPDARGTFSEADGRCKLLANNTGGGFYAQGSQQFVAGAALGAAIGEGIKAQNNYNACMEASGWEIADGAQQAVARPASYTAPPANFSANPPAVTPSYSGEMINGKKEGRGTAIYTDGSKYVGEFKNDVRSGQGIWTDSRGDRYDGEWANDRRNGFGVYVDAKDGVSRGIWQEGNLVKRQLVEPVPVAPVTATVVSSTADPANSASLKPILAPVASSTAASTKPTRHKSASESVASSTARPADLTSHKTISATAAALSVASMKSGPPKPAQVTTSTPNVPSSPPPIACTHQELVEARIATENGYTGGPKCD